MASPHTISTLPAGVNNYFSLKYHLKILFNLQMATLNENIATGLKTNFKCEPLIDVDTLEDGDDDEYIENSTVTKSAKTHISRKDKSLGLMCNQYVYNKVIMFISQTDLQILNMCRKRGMHHW
jgi:hypothetical protein